MISPDKLSGGPKVLSPEDAMLLLGRAKFRRLRNEDYAAFPGINSRRARIAYIRDDATIIIDKNEDSHEWVMHISFNDLHPEQSFRLEKLP